MEHIKGENYLCFYALMEMIIKESGCDDFDQYTLANKLGVVLPTGYVINGVSNFTYSNKNQELGAHIDCQSINNFFEFHQVPIKVSFEPANPYAEYKSERQITEKQFLVYAFSYGSLYNQPQNFQIGHTVLLDKIYDEKSILIYDPGPKDAGLKIVNTDQMHDAMYDARGGIYIFEVLEVDKNE